MMSNNNLCWTTIRNYYASFQQRGSSCPSKQMTAGNFNSHACSFWVQLQKLYWWRWPNHHFTQIFL